MNKTVELPIAESVKLCIELDKKTKEEWENATECVEHAFEYIHGKKVSLTKFEVFQAVLLGFQLVDIPVEDTYASWFDDEEIEAMHKRYLGLLKNKSKNETSLDKT